MKLRKIYQFILFIGIMCIILNFTTHASSDITNNHSYEGKSITIYTFKHDVFETFLKNPTKEILDNNPAVYAPIYSQTENNKNTIKYESPLGNGMYETHESNGDHWRIGGRFFIYSDLIEFVNNTDLLSAFLSEHNICGTISDTYLIYVDKVLFSIYLKVNQDNYFITIDEDLDYIDREDYSAYAYRLYSFTDFYNKFSAKNANLFVNGDNITNENYVKISFSGAYLPLRDVLETLGVYVEWIEENNVINLSYNNEKYIFDPNVFTLTKDTDTSNLFVYPPGGAFYFSEIIDGRTILNDQAMKILLRELDIESTIKVDYENLIIKID